MLPLLILAWLSVAHYGEGANSLGNRLYAFGGNSRGQLGLGDENDRNTPTLVRELFKIGIIDLAAGAQHTLCATTQGVYAWGNNQHGELGLGYPTNDVNHPLILTAFNPTMTIHDLAAGSYHSLVWANSDVYSFGFGFYGQLGLGDKLSHNAPQKIPFFAGKEVQAIAATTFCSFVLADGQVYVFGANYGGALGLGNSTSLYQRSPKQIPFFQGNTVTALSTGIGSHTMVIAGGQLYGWGENTEGELGLGDTITRYTPVLISVLGSPSAPLVTAAQRSELLVGGNLYSMGLNTDGEQGAGSTTTTGFDHPTLVKFFNGKTVTDYGLGRYHTIVLAGGSAYTFGNNTFGELGTGDNTAHSSPVSVDTSVIGGTIVGVRAGGSQSFVITKS